MALFFDARWFDGKLAEAGLGKGDLARAMGLSEEALAEMWKDQRELSPQDIRTLSFMLHESEAEVARRAGVQGSARPAAPPPLPEAAEPSGPAPAALARIEARLTRLETEMSEIKRLLNLLVERR
jgi:hypothetical protein